MLATRPLPIQLESPESYTETRNSSTTVCNLMKLCNESSQQMINIVTSLQEQGLVGTSPGDKLVVTLID